MRYNGPMVSNINTSLSDPGLVIVGLSGGVDSAVAAYLLKAQGLTVEALFMKNWESDDTDEHCTSAQDLQDAQQVCDTLGIVLHQANFAKTYWDKVFTYFLAEYQAGRTPNPDILCNKEIKFHAFLDYAKQLGANKIATGHYAQCQYQAGYYQLHKGMDENKDQSYFLYALNQHQLSHSLFPIGRLEKPAVRDIARKLGLHNHAKKDSTGICFIGERNFTEFLSTYLPAQPGPIQTLEGQTIGQHNGLMFYTVGQRKGLCIGGHTTGNDAPWYVVDKQVPDNTLVVAQGQDHPALFKTTLLARQLHWISGNAPAPLPLSCQAKIRYRQQAVPCTLSCLNETDYHVQFESPQRAITPGQSIVFYTHTQCLGGGIIQ